MKARIKTIVWNDWPSLITMVLIPINWLLYILHPYLFEAQRDMTVLLLSISLTAFCIVILFWRTTKIVNLFKSNNKATGVIEHISFVKDRGRIEYSFSVNGNTIRTWSPVHKSKRVLNMKKGMHVTIFFNPAKPSNSIIGELYV
jgi:hypothetical protein